MSEAVCLSVCGCDKTECLQTSTSIICILYDSVRSNSLPHRPPYPLESYTTSGATSYRRGHQEKEENKEKAVLDGDVLLGLRAFHARRGYAERGPNLAVDHCAHLWAVCLLCIYARHRCIMCRRPTNGHNGQPPNLALVLHILCERGRPNKDLAQLGKFIGSAGGGTQQGLPWCSAWYFVRR